MSDSIKVKYCIDNGDIYTIRIKRSSTVGEFLDEVRNIENNQDLIVVYLRGRPLDFDDLIINFMTRSAVFVVSDDYEKIFDEIEIFSDDDILSPKVKPKSLISFKIFTTVTILSFKYGDHLEFELNYTHEMVHNKIKELIKSFEEPKIPKDFELHIFFPGGIYFSPSDGEIDSNLESFYSLNEKMDHKLYVVVTKPFGDFIDEEIKEPFSILNFNKNILSPLFESTTAGLTQIASLLGYIYYGGFNAQHLIDIFTTTSRFSPMSVNLYRLHQHFELNVLNIIAITCPFLTYISEFLYGIELENVFEYIIPVISFVGLIDQSELKRIDFITFDLNETEKRIEKVVENDNENSNCYLKLFNYLKSFDHQQHVVMWNLNSTSRSFGFDIDLPTNDMIINREILDPVTVYKPICPLSLDLVYHPTFVIGENEEEVFLFINHDYEDENFVYYIDPKVGRVEKSSIENLSIKYRNVERDDYISTVDSNFVDQIVVVCFDLSSSMNLNVKGEKVNDGEISRFQLSKDFLRLFIDELKKLKDSSIYCLVSFDDKVNINEKKVAISSQFLDDLIEINQDNESTFLFDALDSAAKLIQEINVDENGDDDDDDDDDTYVNYKNAITRIIVISDGSDNKSTTSKIDLTNYLIKNNIVLDTIFVSEKIERNFLYAISKLTGGACFQLTNKKDAFNIIEQEAFINAKLREFDLKIHFEINDSHLIEKASNFDAFDVELKNIKNRKSQMLDHLEKPESIVLKYKNKIEKHLDFLALKELNYVCLNPHQNFIVFSESSTPTEWHIFIKGPNETPFENKWLALFMSLSKKFPLFPPSFTFMTAPFHPNVARDGRVTFSMIEKKYKIGVPIASLIEEIIKILKCPDENCIINQGAYDLFISDKVEFVKRQNDFVSVQLEKYGIEPI